MTIKRNTPILDAIEDLKIESITMALEDCKESKYRYNLSKVTKKNIIDISELLLIPYEEAKELKSITYGLIEKTVKEPLLNISGNIYEEKCTKSVKRGKREKNSRTIVAKILGRELNGRKEQVHHIDFNHENNNKDNLLVLTERGHTKLHTELKGLYKFLYQIGAIKYLGNGVYQYHSIKNDEDKIIDCLKEGQIIAEFRAEG